MHERLVFLEAVLIIALKKQISHLRKKSWQTMIACKSALFLPETRKTQPEPKTVLLYQKHTRAPSIFTKTVKSYQSCLVNGKTERQALKTRCHARCSSLLFSVNMLTHSQHR